MYVCLHRPSQFTRRANATHRSNVIYSKPSILLMDSGAHTVEEFSCEKCSTLLGWRIVRAHEWPEKWKEGYCVLELSLLEEQISDRSSSPSPSSNLSVSSDKSSGSEAEGENEVDPKVVAFNAYLQVASALSKGHRRTTSDIDARRPRPVGPRAITPTPATPPRRSVDVRS